MTDDERAIHDLTRDAKLLARPEKGAWRAGGPPAQTTGRLCRYRILAC
jgi:hypothetical protein